MTTVVDPLGSPSVTYNQSGATVAICDASSSNLGALVSTTLPLLPGSINTYLVTGGPGFYVVLPSGIDVGTLCEVVGDPSGPTNRADFASGESLVNYATGTTVGVTFVNTANLRKVSSTTWVLLSTQ